MKKYGLEDNDNQFETKPGIVCRIITSTCSLSEEEIPELFDTIRNAKGIDEVVNSKFRSHMETYETEVVFWIDFITEKAEFNKDLQLIWYENIE